MRIVPSRYSTSQNRLTETDMKKQLAFLLNVMNHLGHGGRRQCRQLYTAAAATSKAPLHSRSLSLSSPLANAHTAQRLLH